MGTLGSLGVQMGARRATITKNTSKMIPGTTKCIPKRHTFRDDGAPKTFKKKWRAFLPVFLSSDKVFQQAEYRSPEMLNECGHSSLSFYLPTKRFSRQRIGSRCLLVQQEDMSSCLTREHVLLFNRKTCLPVEQEDTSSCGTRRHVFLLNENTCFLVEQEDMSSC